MSSFFKLTKLSLLPVFLSLSFPTIADAIKLKEVSIAVYVEHEQYLQASPVYGGSWKILELAAESQNIKLVPQKVNWQGGLQRLKAEKVELAFPAFKTKERETWAIFTLPLIPASSVIYTLPDNPAINISDIDFSSETIGVTSKSVQEVLAKEVGFQHVYATTEREQLFRMLKEKRIDYLFFVHGVGEYYCIFHDKSEKSDCLKTVGAKYGAKSAHALALNTPESNVIMTELNAGLIAIHDTEELKDIFIDYGFSLQDAANWRAYFNKK